MTRKIVYADADQDSVEILSGERLEKLQSLGEFIIYPDAPADDETFIERLTGANAAISGWGLSNRVLAALPDLEVVSFTGLGVSTFIDIAEARRRNITVTHTLSAASTIAEHCLGLMLDAARNISQLDREIRKGTGTPRLWAWIYATPPWGWLASVVLHKHWCRWHRHSV